MATQALQPTHSVESKSIPIAFSAGCKFGLAWTASVLQTATAPVAEAFIKSLRFIP
jgi:hypothetical protein